ncbi:hypothetical protein [Spirosoma endbachense]|uniref:T9SS type A sorting domain-containing protein n=1 Tax=Spirosoma endbachense TaxID=2666025 RepID=A0A6P1W2N0_9BACT|nr:hypothetical protein [Spirosoma endbachense]QHV98818.1 hypothetical protein GJR95_29120 [Spirosoma endbachense]
MKSFMSSMVFAFNMSLVLVAAPIQKTTAQSPRPTKLARYQMASYISADSTKLRVNVNKELGGQVYVHLLDLRGNVLFEKTMAPVDTTVRLSLNLMELIEGDYTLKVSNGLEAEVREFKIKTRKPRKITRTITLL